MRLKTFALGAAAVLGAVGLTGAAAAATRNGHVMTVQLPDGAVAHILYFGDTPPQVRLQRAQPLAAAAGPDSIAGLFDPGLPAVDSVMVQMDRQADLMFAQAQRLMRAAPGGQGLQRAQFGQLPAGATGYSYVSTFSANGACTREVEYRSTGNGAPQVASRTSGNCGGQNAAPSRTSSAAAGGQAPLRLLSVAYHPAS